MKQSQAGTSLAGRLFRTMAPSHLLQLPLEIRLEILQQLLFRPEPLAPRPIPCPQCAAAVPKIAVYTHVFEHREQKKTLGLFTEVLRACRQLHDEGTPVLHSNTASVIAWNYLHPSYQNLVPAASLVSIGHTQYQSANLAGCEIGLRAECPLQKVHLTVKISTRHEVYELLTLFEHIILILQHSLPLKELGLSLEIEANSSASLVLSSTLFRFFNGVRGISYAKVTGLDESGNTQLAALMMRPETNA